MPRSQNTEVFRVTEKTTTYRGSLSLLATLAMCFTFLCVVLLERPAAGSALHGLQTGQLRVTNANLGILLQLALLPIVSAIAAYVVAAMAIQRLRLALYRRSVHQFAGSWLRTYAPLHAAGVHLVGVPYDASGAPLSGQERSLESMAGAERSLLLLGPEGAGKTSVLHALAHELTHRRAHVAIAVRRIPLPILIHCGTLTDDALSSQAGFIQWLKQQVLVFGTKGLAARLPRMLRRGRVVLLCDGLDELATADRKAVSELLAGLVTASAGHTTAVLTCNLRTYEDAPQSYSQIKTFDRLIISPVREDDTLDALRKHQPRGGARRLSATDVRSALAGHRLTLTTRRPAALAALMALASESPNAESWPYGRAELLRSYARSLCGTSPNDNGQTERQAIVLGALAVSLRQADMRTIEIPKAHSVGRVVTGWLEDVPPLTPTEVPMESSLIATPEEAETICQTALKHGILARTADGSRLGFASSVLEAAFAAWWLDLMDDGLGRVNAELLFPRWALPVVLWAGAQHHPADLASRLYRLADTPESTATRAGLSVRETAPAATLALSLAALCEGLAGTLAREATPATGEQRVAEIAQQHLRDLLDDMQRQCEQPEDEDRLRAALEEVERRCGPELVDSVIYLARSAQLNRLVRAQLAVLLGLIASPAAVAGIMALLDEPDAVMRQAVNAAILTAGAVCLEPLQAALHSPRDRVRSRAEEALALLGDDAIEAALTSLGGAGAAQRASAARTLGRLHAEQATDSLIRRLDDTEGAVRVAAARALGQIASGQALVALEQHATSPDATLRAAIAQALGQAHDPEALPTLLRLFGDTEPAVRAEAAAALGVLGDERAAVPLRERRDDPDPWTQHAVVLALQRLGKE